MTQVTRITGVPGAGKSFLMTSKAFRAVDEDGYNWDDVRFISFTRSHASDLRSDLLDRFRTWRDDPDEDEEEAFNQMRWDRVSTLHAWALAQTDIDADDVIALGDPGSTQPYSEFWSRKGVRGGGTTTNPLRVKDEGRNIGTLAQIIGIEQWLALHTVEPSAQSVRWAPFSPEVDAGWLAAQLSEWRKWKEENEWFEHHDYLRRVVKSGVVPDEPVVLVDETQDYAPLEYLCIQNWLESEQPDHVVVAGDPQQNIYGFKGARSAYLTGLDAHEEKRLDTSRRCPSEVAEVARAICPESKMDARSTGGDVRRVSVPDKRQLATLVQQLAGKYESVYDPVNPHLSGAAVMLLTRTNRHAGMVMEALHQHGIPYASIGQKTLRPWQNDGDHYPWTRGICGIVRALRDVRAGDKPSTTDSEAVLEVTPGWTPEYEEVDSLTKYVGASDPDKILDQVQLDDREERMVRKALQHDLPVRPSRVQVGTIHEAKGREAPAVVLMAGYPSRLADRWDRDDEFRKEERRLYYVAVSRSSNHLTVTHDFCGGSAMPLFRDGIPRAPESEVIV